MPRYAFSPSIEISLRTPRETANERRDRYRGPLKIATPAVTDEELRKKWYGAPPSRVELKRRPDTSAF